MFPTKHLLGQLEPPPCETVVARAPFQMQNSTTYTSASNGTNSQNNTGTIQIPPFLTLNFDELKKEMDQFGQVFGDWVGDKRRILTDDKENYLKTLAEEAGKISNFLFFIYFYCILNYIIIYQNHGHYRCY